MKTHVLICSLAFLFIAAFAFFLYKKTNQASIFSYSCRAAINNSITMNGQSYTIKAKYSLHPEINNKITFSINGLITNNKKVYIINRDYLLEYSTSGRGEYKIEQPAFNSHASDNADDVSLMPLLFPQKNKSAAIVRIFKIGQGAILIEDTSDPLFICSLEK
ncbi:hypothetical protein QCK34_004483 [Enterobacter asburiae]|nr:hypothetical protein [Enterobacter asburiae]